MAKKSMNLGKMVKKNLRKLEKMSILKSSVTLYATLFLALMTVLVYISKSDWNSLIVLIATGLLTNYFTKNMIITLGMAILVSVVVRHKVRNIEGMDSNIATGEHVETKENAADSENTKTDDNEKQESDSDGEVKKNCYNNVDGKWVGTGLKKESECAAPMCWEDDSTNCKEAFSKKSIPSSKPQRVDGGGDDPEGDDIDYTKTLEGAYDNLQDMLGADGIKSLTSETNELIKQQKDLMGAIKGLGPMMKEAKGLMSSLKGMGNLGNFGKK
tara:strand:+ start:3026 stop:3838 length:813 start_codon:yes stop_codon:yes gene_type:complete